MLGSFFFQAEDGIRDLVRSRGLGDVYKRQIQTMLLILKKLLMVSLAAIFSNFVWNVTQLDTILMLIMMVLTILHLYFQLYYNQECMIH